MTSRTFAGGVGRRTAKGCSPLKQLQESKSALRRRDFLALSTVAAGAALLPRFAGADPLTRAESLSTGYVVGSDRLENVFTLPWGESVPEAQREEQWVVPAESLPAGDSSMAFSFIALKVHGLYPAMPPSRDTAPLTTIFTVYFHLPWLGLTEPLPFHAWGARFGKQATAGSPARFIVPTREDGSLAMSFDIIPSPKVGGPRRKGADFTVDQWAGRPKLQRGIYLLGIGPSAFAREQQLPANPDSAPWELCSLVLSVDHLQEGDI